MKMLALFCVFLSFLPHSVCATTSYAIDHFVQLLQLRLASTHLLEDIHPALMKKGSAGFPPGVWDVVFKATTLAGDKARQKKWCLLLKYPLSDKSGEMRFVQESIGRACEQYIYDGSAKSIRFAGPFSISLKRKTETQSPFLSFQLGQKGYRIHFYNLTSSALALALERKLYPAFKFGSLETSATQFKIPGVQVHSVFTSEREVVWTEGHQRIFVENPLEYKGDRALCHKIATDCTSERDYECDQCDWGVFEMSGQACATGGNKVCAPVVCGQKDAPACRRGRSYHLGKRPQGCHRKSGDAFCEKGLELECFDGMLYCR